MSIASRAQTFTSLISFNRTNGAIPAFGALIQGIDGNLYGATSEGGANAGGTLFKITGNGQLTTFYSFCAQTNCADGAGPMGGLVQAPSGDFYGTNYAAGTFSDGTVFKITPNGELTTLHTFDGFDGALPNDTLVLATDGNLYGTTDTNGSHDRGTVFKLTPTGVLTTLHNFSGDPPAGMPSTDGSNPFGLIQAASGEFYGLAGGGLFEDGVVFEIDAAGHGVSLHSFDGTDGVNPVNELVQATDGNFYGITSAGGLNGVPGCPGEGGLGGGTILKITPGGVLTTLYSFAGSDGANPLGGLVQATDGNFYGTTVCGGLNNDGTVFKITSNGELTTLHSFAGSDGSLPFGTLVQATDGDFYGTTSQGGASNDGKVFKLSGGLGAFVKTLPASGRVGAGVRILGTDLTGATAVTFNGIPSAFTVLSPSEITTTVPAGAITGTVQVVTPSATLSSSMPFVVP
jgi:uncharacterized repeat protein (TIGR03803 family)